MKPVRPARGYTLIELLVVVAIIGVLLALLIPAVQEARDATRRIQCVNNLRQIGTALHAYHARWSTFPPGGIEWRPFPKMVEKKQLAWSAFLLPYLDASNVDRILDLNSAFDSPANAKAAATVLPVYICPTTPRKELRIDGRAVCDYGGIYGERITGPNFPPKGVMIYDRPISLRMITDGATYTVAVAEDANSPDGQWINGRNIFDQAFAINAAPPFENDMRSYHRHGVNILLADGAARFLSDRIDLLTLAALCTREQLDPVGSF